MQLIMQTIKVLFNADFFSVFIKQRAAFDCENTTFYITYNLQLRITLLCSQRHTFFFSILHRTTGKVSLTLRVGGTLPSLSGYGKGAWMDDSGNRLAIWLLG